MKKQASAVWQGSVKEGGGTISTETGVLKDAPYGFQSRFESGKGTNPEELIGAAHAGCYSMALSMLLGEAGFVPQKIETRAEVTLEKKPDGFAITESHLIVRAEVPNAREDQFLEIANRAKAGCVISKALSVPVSLDAALSNQTQDADAQAALVI